MHRAILGKNESCSHLYPSYLKVQDWARKPAPRGLGI